MLNAQGEKRDTRKNRAQKCASKKKEKMSGIQEITGRCEKSDEDESPC